MKGEKIDFERYDNYANSEVIESYKSRWRQSECGNYVREQRDKYPAEWLVPKFFAITPKLRSLKALLGKKPQGVDYYKYYCSVIDRAVQAGDLGKWVADFSDVKEDLKICNVDLEGQSVLDISGEPGFFGVNARKICSSVTVTAFADEVAISMRDRLGLVADKYDFNHDLLASTYAPDAFDTVFVRYAIGFSENLLDFASDVASVIKQGGGLYISFSPASRAICARWMFDDYTYLRQYRSEYLIKAFEANGFSLVRVFDKGRYRWDDGLSAVQKFCSRPYLNEIFKGQEEREYYQYNQACFFVKC